MTKKQRYFSVLISFAIIFCIGCLYKILNEKTTIDGVPYYAIQSAYIQKFNQAYETLDRLEEYILENKIDQIHKHLKDENNCLYYYLSKNATVIFWSKNFLISQNNSALSYLE